MFTVEDQPAAQAVNKRPEKHDALPLAWLTPRKVVVVHAGCRDAYQLALAFSDAGMLQELVTDFFWSEQSKLSKVLAKVLPASIITTLRKRSASRPLSCVRQRITAGLKGFLLDRARWLSFDFRMRLTRSADETLGKAAGLRARQTGAALVSYSYYAATAFRAFGAGAVLFQMHPHPASMRRILEEELRLHPDCANSLKQEWELALDERDFAQLVEEPKAASRILVASSFTRNTLIENGIPQSRICVVPYGVDLNAFHSSPKKAATRTAKLQLLFVGRINQRKGLKYLLEALRLLNDSSIRLVICGRVLDDLSMFTPFLSQVEIRPSVTKRDLVRAYQESDLFVFPSVGEGFGQVLLEAMACGLPLLATDHTAAPDLVTEGFEGFVVEPRRPDLLAERIAWAASHRGELLEMGNLARQRAETFDWARFRKNVVAATADMFQAREDEMSAEVAHVI